MFLLYFDQGLAEIAVSEIAVSVSNKPLPHQCPEFLKEATTYITMNTIVTLDNWSVSLPTNSRDRDICMVTE